MDDSSAFAATCEALEALTSMSRLEARGTMRLALKEAGLEPHTVAVRSLVVVVERVLPALLRTRKVADIPAVCASLKVRLLADASSRPAAYEAPEDILARFSRSK